jgi:hypothetical protein
MHLSEHTRTREGESYVDALKGDHIEVTQQSQRNRSVKAGVIS